MPPEQNRRREEGIPIFSETSCLASKNEETEKEMELPPGALTKIEIGLSKSSAFPRRNDGQKGRPMPLSLGKENEQDEEAKNSKDEENSKGEDRIE